MKKEAKLKRDKANEEAEKKADQEARHQSALKGVVCLCSRVYL